MSGNEVSFKETSSIPMNVFSDQKLKDTWKISLFQKQASANQDFSNPVQQVQLPNQSNRPNNFQQRNKSQGQAPPWKNRLVYRGESDAY